MQPTRRYGARSREVRWILPGHLDAAVAEWFAHFPCEMQSRTDLYLIDPQLNRLSVKIRDTMTFEVKVYCQAAGNLKIAGRAGGRMELWQKWSFPCQALSLDGSDPAVWAPVSKSRRISWFSLAGGHRWLPLPARSDESGCQVELTQFYCRGAAWWSLGFEAAGPAELLRSELQGAATLVFGEPLPDSMEFCSEYSLSYAEWLGLQLGDRTVNP